jgi:hypothetical protein
MNVTRSIIVALTASTRADMPKLSNPNTGLALGPNSINPIVDANAAMKARIAAASASAARRLGRLPAVGKLIAATTSSGTGTINGDR